MTPNFECLNKRIIKMETRALYLNREHYIWRNVYQAGVSFYLLDSVIFGIVSYEKYKYRNIIHFNSILLYF